MNVRQVHLDGILDCLQHEMSMSNKLCFHVSGFRCRIRSICPACFPEMHGYHPTATAG